MDHYNGQPDVTKTTTIGSDGVTTDGTVKVTNSKDGKDAKDLVTINGKDGEGHIGLTGKDGESADITVVQGDAGLQNNTVEDKDPKYMDRIQYKDSAGKEHQVYYG